MRSNRQHQSKNLTTSRTGANPKSRRNHKNLSDRHARLLPVGWRIWTASVDITELPVSSGSWRLRASVMARALHKTVKNVFCYTSVGTAGIQLPGVVLYPLGRVEVASTKFHQEGKVAARKTTGVFRIQRVLASLLQFFPSASSPQCYE